MQVYETGPLKGLPRRAGHIRLVSPPIGDAMKAAPSPAAATRRNPARLPDVEPDEEFFADWWAWSGDPDLNDALEIPGIPADATPPPITVTEARPFRSSSAFAVILMACALLYFAVRILGVGA